MENIIEDVRHLDELTKAYCKDNNIPYHYISTYHGVKSARKGNSNYNIYVIVDGIEYHSPKRLQRKKIDGGGFFWRFVSDNNETIEFDNSPRVFAKRTKQFWEIESSPEIKIVGKYKDHHKGGCYSYTDKYEYKGKFYAFIQPRGY